MRQGVSLVEGKTLSPKQEESINIMLANPELSFDEISLKVGVSRSTLWLWRNDPFFIEEYLKASKIYLGSQLPKVDAAIMRKALSGDVHAYKAINDVWGRILRKVEHTVISPFEMWSQRLESKEVKEVEAEVVEGDFYDEEIDEKALQEEDRKRKKREWYALKQRAKRVGLEPIKTGRPTAAEKKAWIDKLQNKEEEAMLSEMHESSQ